MKKKPLTTRRQASRRIVCLTLLIFACMPGGARQAAHAANGKETPTVTPEAVPDAPGPARLERANSPDPFEWTRHARIVTFDGYVPPLYPEKRYDPEEMVRLAVDLHANTIRVSAMGKIAYFRTDQWEVAPGFDTGDPLAELIERAHAAGIRVAPYIPGAVHLPVDLLLEYHPEWVQRQRPNQPLDETARCGHSGTRNAHPCPLGPYREFYEEMVREVIINHDVDAWYNDAWKQGYFEPVCYCDACREAFRLDRGEDLFDDEFAPGGERQGEVRAWYHQRLVRMVQEMHALVRRHKRVPSILNRICNAWGGGTAGAWGPEIDAMHDVVHYERMTDPYHRLVSAGYLGVRDVRAWFYAGTYDHTQFTGPEGAEENYRQERRFIFRKELYNEAFITLACGAGVNCQRANSLLFDADSPGRDIFRDIYGLAGDHPEVFEQTRYAPFVAVLNATEVSGAPDPWRFARPLIEAGVQTTMFKRSDLTDRAFLRCFAALITEDVSEEDQRAIVENYVRHGGRWITTGDATAALGDSAAALPAPEDARGATLSGSGVVVRIDPDIETEALVRVLRWAAGGVLPMRVATPAGGRVIPVLGVSPDRWVVHLANVTKHLSGTFESGLEEIPPVPETIVTLSLPGGREASARRLRTGEPVEPVETAEGLRYSLRDLEEYDALVVTLD